jgi:hypothetical protein
VKTSRRSSFVLAVALLTIAVGYPGRLSAETAPRWSVQVSQVNAGATSLTPSFQAAIYENVLEELSKTKRFRDVLRDGDHTAGDVADLLVLKTTVEKYTAGSETLRAATTVGGWTKLKVRTQLSTRDSKVVFERTLSGNVRFFGSNLRATHNLARTIAKSVKKSPLPEPHSPAEGAVMNSGSSDDVVVVEFP